MFIVEISLLTRIATGVVVVPVGQELSYHLLDIFKASCWALEVAHVPSCGDAGHHCWPRGPSL